MHELVADMYMLVRAGPPGPGGGLGHQRSFAPKPQPPPGGAVARQVQMGPQGA